MEPSDIRWKQRFQNYSKALEPLDRAVSCLKQEPDNEIYQMATIQAFKFCFELAWKTLKDFLVYQGLNVESFPRSVIKEAFNIDLIENGQSWMQMLKDRNVMSHEYSFEKTQRISMHIVEDYIHELHKLRAFFETKLEK